MFIINNQIKKIFDPVYSTQSFPEGGSSLSIFLCKSLPDTPFNLLISFCFVCCIQIGLLGSTFSLTRVHPHSHPYKRTFEPTAAVSMFTTSERAALSRRRPIPYQSHQDHCIDDANLQVVNISNNVNVDSLSLRGQNHISHYFSFPLNPFNFFIAKHHKLVASTNTTTHDVTSSLSITEGPTKLLLATRPHPSRFLRLPFTRRRSNEGSDEIDKTGRRRSKSFSSAEVNKMAIYIRSDVRLSAGRVGYFAATIAVRLFQRVCTTQNACASWNRSGQRKVVLPVSGDDGVARLIKYAKDHNIAVAGVRVKVENNNNSGGDGSRGNRSSPNFIKSAKPTTTTASSSRYRNKKLETKNDTGNVNPSETGVAGVGHKWIAIGLFGPDHLLQAVTKNLPQL